MESDRIKKQSSQKSADEIGHEHGHVNGTADESPPETRERSSTMQEVEDEIYEEKDDSRPFFQRQPCEVGIYISVYTATATEDNTVGLEHFFLMHTEELLYDYFRQQDKVDIRAQFVAKDTLTQMYIERFEPGIVMAVGFDSASALDDLWERHRQGTLTSLLHDILITSDAMKAAMVTDVTLVTKLWEDEYDVCKAELESKTTELVDIATRPEDLKLVERLRRYQKVLGTEVSNMRDLENEMEINRTEFMNCIRNILPSEHEGFKTLQEYETLANSAKARKSYYKDLITMYLNIIQKWREYYKIFEVEIVTPFLQIHSVVENAKQKATRHKVVTSVRDMQQTLKPGASLEHVSHPEIAKKIMRRDCPTFLGLLSLIPIGVERMSDIDLFIDEYTREFKIDTKLLN